MLFKKVNKLEKWNVFTETAQVEDVLEASGVEPQLIYKHSHTCGTCLVAKSELEKNFEAINEKAGMNFINVIKNREVSNTIAEKLGVRHESPQVLIVKKGKCVWAESHFAIETDAILNALSE